MYCDQCNKKDITVEQYDINGEWRDPDDNEITTQDIKFDQWLCNECWDKKYGWFR